MHATDRTELARRLGLALWSSALLLTIIRTAGLVARGAPPGRHTGLEILRQAFVAASIAFIATAYIVRRPPRSHAAGCAERLFPLLIAALSGAFLLLRGAPPAAAAYVTGTLLCLAGTGLAAWGLAHLRGSFSVMAEVRTLVRDGPYRVVRHPVYAGEILNWLGLGLLFGGGPVLAYAAGLAVLQALRARVEERKLAGVLGAQYAEYRAAAGFLVPRPRGQVKTVPRAVERPFHHK